jgi:hypothetical protein
VAKQPPKTSAPVPLKLVNFNAEDWEQPGDASWQTFQRWVDARKDYCAKHPAAEAVLGTALQRMQYELSLQHPKMFGHLRNKRPNV